MSRSKHSTRKQYKDEKRWDYSDPKLKRQRLREIAEEIWEKRRIKYEVKNERSQQKAQNLPVESPDTIPVQFKDEEEYVHYFTTEEEVRTLLRLLPEDLTHGLQKIEFTIGKEYQKEHYKSEYDEDDLDDMDPYLNRFGIEVFPNIHSGFVYGTYDPQSTVISCYAFIGSSKSEHWNFISLFLKLQILSTLFHELAHHDDYMRRTRQGRWLKHQKEKVEIYAEKFQHIWGQEILLPYLHKTYPNEIQCFEYWIKEKIKVPFPFESFCKDSRRTMKGGGISLKYFLRDPLGMLCDLFLDIENDVPEHEFRRKFAEDLHFTNEFELAIQVIEEILKENPNDLLALTEKADYLHHLERDSEGREIARKVVKQDPDILQAWRVIENTSESLLDWESALIAYKNIRRLKEKRSPMDLINEARCLLELEQYDEFNKLITQAKEYESIYVHLRASGLIAISLLRQNRFQEALDLAQKNIAEAEKTTWAYELLAVEFEALHKLGRGNEAKSLDDKTLNRLEGRNYGPWVDTLKGLG